MLNYYQPFLLPFLHTKRYNLPIGVCRKFYISFEDGLWNLLKSRNINLGSTIFVPDFYCMDVVQNIQNHGYIPVFYPLDNHFQISKINFDQLIQKHTPSVVILFHACGIQNKLLSDTAYIQRLAQKSLVIEDAVQRLVNPENLKLLHENHVIIDSLRKTSPLHGSFLYGSKQLIHSIDDQNHEPELVYQFITFLLFLMFKIVFCAGVLFQSNALVRYAHIYILKKHDDYIGDSTNGHNGPWYIPFIHQYICFSRIEHLKQKQSIHYFELLKKTQSIKTVYNICIDKQSYKYLHAFPVGFKITKKNSHDSINEYFKQLNIPVWTKFPDCPWSKTRAVLFLPLGFHVRYNEIDKVCTMLHKINYL